MMPQANYSTSAQLIADEIRSLMSRGDIEVPLLPEVANKVVQLSQDPESTANKLAALIQADQTLAAHVIRVANSAMYSPASSIVSLQQAITRLGMTTISEIALAATINAELFNAPGFEKHINASLIHALACGLWAKEVARACRRNVESAFLGGLLHDIGGPIVINIASKISKKQRIPLTSEDITELRTTLGRELSSTVVKKWEMPISVQEVVTYFDNYQSPHDARNQTVVAVGGSVIAGFYQNHSPSDKIDELVAHPIFSELNLYLDEIEKITERAEKVDETLKSMRA